MKKNRNRSRKVRLQKSVKYVGISVAIFLISLFAASASSILLARIQITSTQSPVIADMIGGIIAAVAAALVIYQLRLDDVERKRQNDIDEATFILEYNRSFIQDSKMTEVESLLEQAGFYGLEEPIFHISSRQQFINYLVYLEGISPVILNGVLRLEHIDDLMAYRFFLAVNNPEMQREELVPYAEYYRGCYALYQFWSEYRRKNHLVIPLEETALDRQEIYRYVVVDASTENLVGKQLTKKDQLSKQQYVDLVRLIVETDPYIYPALFAGENSPLEIAEELLPALIEQGTDQMFNKKNMYILTADNIIVGLILWHQGALTWDAESFLKFAENRGIKLDEEKVWAVAREYVASQYEAGGKSGAPISLINVCVANYMRNKGIGGAMIEKFIAEHDREDMELVTLSDNGSAVSLYRKNGFVILSKNEGFSLSKEKPACYCMARYAKEYRH